MHSYHIHPLHHSLPSPLPPSPPSSIPREQVVGEDRALCTSEFSDISPLTGGNVAFSTLEGRPSEQEERSSYFYILWLN